MRVCFRVDASYDIGSGHVVRCKTLAQHLRSLGLDVRFVCRDLAGNMISSIRRDGFPVFLLKGAQFFRKKADIDVDSAALLKMHATLRGFDWPCNVFCDVFKDRPSVYLKVNDSGWTASFFIHSITGV